MRNPHYGHRHVRFPIGRPLIGTLGALLIMGSLLLPAKAALAGAATARDEMIQAQTQVAALAALSASASVQQALADATQRLSAGSTQSLWANSNEPIAPPDGTAVFDDSGTALGDLESIEGQLPSGGVTLPAVQSVESLVLAADQDAVTQTVAFEAAPNTTGIAAVNALTVSGGRAALDGRGADAAGLYREAWTLFYRQLNDAVLDTTLSTRFSSIVAGAQAALADPTVSTFLIQDGALPQPMVNAPALTSGGKPEVFYLGVGACPYCGAERWGLMLGMAQFGRFSGVSLGESASFTHWLDNLSQPVRTFSFYGSTFASPYLAFVPVEWASNQPGSNAYGLAPLQALTGDQVSLVDTYMNPPFCAGYGIPSGVPCFVPWIDAGNRYYGSGTVDIQPFDGLSWASIAAGLADPSRLITKYVDAAAVINIAQVCALDGSRPASICGNGVVQTYLGLINSGSPITY